MKKMYQIPDLNRESNEELNRVKDLLEYQRIHAENRFILIQRYKDFLEFEAQRLGKKFRKVQALKVFCNQNHKNWKTFYGYLTVFKKGGIEAIGRYVSTFHTSLCILFQSGLSRCCYGITGPSVPILSNPIW